MTNYYVEYLLNFMVSLRWIWIIVVIVVANFLKEYASILRERNSIQRDSVIKDIVIDDNATEALDKLINEVLEEYVILNIKPKDIYYINSKMENEMIESIKNEVSNRISILLLKKISYTHNEDYIGTFIGMRIYLVITNFVVEFNVNNKSIKK